MRQSNKVLLSSFFILTLVIVSGLMLFGTQAEPTNCQPLERIGRECVPRGPKTCPNPKLKPLPPCTLDAAK
jgi:hypothetical protein